MKKLWNQINKIAGTTLVLSLVFLLACNHQEQEHKIEVWTMQLKPTFNDYMNGVFDKYKKLHPDVEIEWVDLPAKEIEQKTLTAIAGGKAPDIVNLNPDFTAKLAEVGALVDLEKKVDNTIKNHYFPNIWRASTFNNETYGFPWYLSTAITIYNTELFKKAKLPTNQPPRNFTELAAMGRIIKKQTGKYIFTPNFADKGKILSYMVQEGISLLTKDQQKAAFNTSHAEKFIQFWIDLAKDKIIPQDSITQGHREVIDRFQAGESAILISGPQFLKIVRENSPQLYEKLAIAPQITGNSGKTEVGVMNLVVPKASKKIDDAVKLARFITNSDNQLAFAKIVTILPSAVEAAKDPYFTELGAKATLEDRARKISSEQLSNAEVLLPVVKKWSELSKSFDQYFQQAYLGQLSVKDALNKAEAEWNQILNN